MNYTKIKLGKEARDAIMRGAESLYLLTSTTQGPRGRNIAINKNYDITLLHDGLQVSRFVIPKDKFEALGADIIREAAEQQGGKVGDGTTLTIVLGYAIAREAMTLIDAGINPMSLVKGLEKGRDVIVEEVKRLSIPVTTQKQKIEVATVSAEDANLGKMIGETYHKIGVDAVITADESKSHETVLEHQEGISIDHGYMSPYFITNPRDMTATVKEARILFLDHDLENIYDLLPFIDKELKPREARSLVIIAKSVTGSAFASLITTKMKGLMSILCVKAPSFGKYQREMMEDMAIMCGGAVIDEASGTQIKDATFDYLGYAEAVKSSRDSTTIIESKGEVKKIKDRIASIKLLMDEPDSDLDQEKLKERLAKMTGGVYVVKTGGATEVEMNERKERVDDAIKATRAAIIAGIVPGGEMALLTARNKLKASNEQEEYAYRILNKACEKPFDKLLDNAGLNPGYYMAKLEREEFGWGVDVTDNTIKNLLKAGIVDPTLVVTEALRSAVSVAISLITVDGASVLVESKDDN